MCQNSLCRCEFWCLCHQNFTVCLKCVILKFCYCQAPCRAILVCYMRTTVPGNWFGPVSAAEIINNWKLCDRSLGYMLFALREIIGILGKLYCLWLMDSLDGGIFDKKAIFNVFNISDFSNNFYISNSDLIAIYFS